MCAMYLIFQRSLGLYLFCLKASRRLHEKMLQGVIDTGMQFFHKNTSGRIINRFSKDLYDVDYYLALVLYDLTLVSATSTLNAVFLNLQFIISCRQICLQATMSLILVGLTNIWVMFATLVMSFVFYKMRYIYVNSARDLRRLEALGKHMNCVLAHYKMNNPQNILCF